MNWVSSALLSAITFAAVNILDSHLISRRLPGWRAYLLAVGAVHLVPALAVFFLNPLPEDLPVRTLLIALGSGAFRISSIVITFYCLEKEEVSRVIPVTSTYPVFVAILAMPLLGERLTGFEWLAVFIVVAGAITVSLKRDSSGAPIIFTRITGLLLVASLFLAIADLVGKYVLDSISFWNLFWLDGFVISGAFLSISLRPSIIRQIRRVEHKRTAFSLLVADEAGAATAIMLSFWSIARGPVSLVSTIRSSRPLFVLVIAFIFSRIMPKFLKWEEGREQLALRLIGTGLIIGGIAIIYL